MHKVHARYILFSKYILTLKRGIQGNKCPSILFLINTWVSIVNSIIKLVYIRASRLRFVRNCLNISCAPLIYTLTHNTTRALFLLRKSLHFLHFFLHFKFYFTNKLTNTRHVCTYLNVLLMVIPNIVTKFQNLDIFSTICVNLICRLLTPAAC